MDGIWTWIQCNPQLTSAAVAFAAFLVALSQAWFARDHNKRSVRPLLGIRKRIAGTDVITGGAKSFEISLINAGLGPAVFEAAQICVDSGKFELLDTPALLRAADVLFEPDNKRTNTSPIMSGEVLAKDETRTLLKLSLLSADGKDTAPTNDDALRLFEQVNKHSFQFIFVYSTLHGEYFEQDTRCRGFLQQKLRWYTRWARRILTWTKRA